MTIYNTGNATPSVDARDLNDNMIHMEEFALSELDYGPDRFGVDRLTMQGIRNASQYVDLGPYAAGLVFTSRNQVFSYLGEFYAPGPAITLPYTTTGAGAGEIANFRSVGDATLRADLLAADGAERVKLGSETVAEILERIDFTQNSVSPREFGAVTGTDATTAIQAALSDPRPILVIDEPYLHNPEIPMLVPSNKTIVFIKAGSTTAIPCDSGSHRAFDVTMKENVTFINPQVYGERAGHIGTTGESGFGIYVIASKNVKIYGGLCKDWWGDGIYIGAFSVGTHYNCESVLVDGVTCDNNRRQGMSITAAVGVKVRGGNFNNTNGTAPQSGIDIEPNASFACRDIEIIGAEAVGNIGSGFMAVNVAGGGLADACDRISFINCKSIGNSFHGVRLIKSLNTQVQDCRSLDNGGSGVDLSGGCNNADVTGNLITGNGTYGIGAVSIAGDNINIQNNRVYDNAGHGVDVDPSSPDANVVNNDCRRNGLSGIRTQGATATVKINRLVNNGIVNTSAKNLEITGAGSIVTGNTARSSGSGAVTGVVISGSGQTVMGNDFRGAGVTTDLTNTATGSVVRDNFPKVASSTTAGRPALYLQIGDSLFDTTLNKLITWNGTVWKDGAGTTV
jgi:hypothetical protein